MKFITHTLTIFFTLFLSFSANGDDSKMTTISGKVVDKGGNPISSALVGIVSIQKFVLTDENGGYTMTNIPHGKYTVDISTIYAEPKSSAIECKSPTQALMFEVDARDAIEIEEVVVTAKSDAAVIKERGFALSVVNTNSSVLTTLPASELLDRSSGVRLRQSGGVGSNIDYSINGLSGGSIKVFIDGISIDNYGASFSLSSILKMLWEVL